jgi:hypothetical protein
LPNFSKSSLNCCQAKKCQNIYIRGSIWKYKTCTSLLKRQNTCNKTCSETVYLDEYAKYVLKQKAAQNITFYVGYFTFSKYSELPKVAQLTKYCQI